MKIKTGSLRLTEPLLARNELPRLPACYELRLCNWRSCRKVICNLGIVLRQPFQHGAFLTRTELFEKSLYHDSMRICPLLGKVKRNGLELQCDLSICTMNLYARSLVGHYNTSYQSWRESFFAPPMLYYRESFQQPCYRVRSPEGPPR